MKIKVEHERCVGSGSCVLASPAVFDQDELDGRVILLDADPDESLRRAVTDAVHVCPAAAIRVIEN